MPSHFDRNISNLSFIEFVNVFSIWVVLGAPISMLFFFEVFNVSIDLYDILCLTLSVWVIYTSDHLLDGYKRKEYSPVLRHKIHYQYRKAIIPLLVISTGVLAGVSFSYLSAESRQIGLSIIIGVIIYFFTNKFSLAIFKKPLHLKEFLIALVVTVSFAGIPFSHSNSNLALDSGLLLVSFGLLNLSNLLLFSYYDYELDLKFKLASIGFYLSKSQLNQLIWGTLALATLSVLALFFLSDLDILSVIILLVMLLQLIVIKAYPRTFRWHERYRFFGDLIYLYPALYILF